MTGPTVPVSGPEDGARALPYPLGRGCCGAPDATACHQRGLCWMEGVHPESPGFVADTTAGEADAVSSRRGIWVEITDECNGGDCDGCGECWTPTPAARSGGAQDDGLRQRLEALAEIASWWPGGPGSQRQREIDRLRRALAGPDDTQQDGAR